MKATTPKKPADACPVATVSIVITAMASVQKMSLPNWARVYVSNSNMITVKDAACVPWSALVELSGWRQRASNTSVLIRVLFPSKKTF